MIPFDPTLAASLGTRRAIRRMMLRLDLESASYGFWSGQGPFGPYEGVLYVGSGQLIQIEAQSGDLSASVSPLTVTLSSIPNTQLTPDVLATIFDEVWHQKPAVLSRAYFHPDTRALLGVRRASRRVIDTIVKTDQVDGQSKLTLSLEPVTFDNPRRGYMKFGDPDQRLIDPNDGFFSFAATAGSQTIEWGRAPANPTSGAPLPGRGG